MQLPPFEKLAMPSPRATAPTAMTEGWRAGLSLQASAAQRSILHVSRGNHHETPQKFLDVTAAASTTEAGHAPKTTVSTAITKLHLVRLQKCCKLAHSKRPCQSRAFNCKSAISQSF